MIQDLRRRAAVLIFVVMVVGIQFIRPELNPPPGDPAQSLFAQSSTPADLRALLMRCCNDCHGVAERWPWYAHVAPVSWLIGSDVTEAQDNLNFSDWGAMEPQRQAWALRRMCEEVRKGGMPLPRYLWLHRSARLTPAEIAKLCGWTAGESERLQGAGH